MQVLVYSCSPVLQLHVSISSGPASTTAVDALQPMLHCLLPLLRPGTLITSSIANAAKWVWSPVRGPEYYGLMSWVLQEGSKREKMEH